MGFKKIILTILLLISFCTTPVLAAYQVDARTERIPAGTVMTEISGYGKHDIISIRRSIQRNSC